MNLFLIENDKSLLNVLAEPTYVQGKDAILCFNYLVYLQLKKVPQAHLFLFVEAVS